MPANDEASTILLRRGLDSASWLARLSIEIDGEVVASLRMRQQQSVTVAPGVYELIARHQPEYSNQLRVRVEPGETVEILCKSSYAAYLRRVPGTHDTLLLEEVSRISETIPDVDV